MSFGYLDVKNILDSAESWGEMNRDERLQMIEEAKSVRDGTDNPSEKSFYDAVIRRLTESLDV